MISATCWRGPSAQSERNSSRVDKSHGNNFCCAPERRKVLSVAHFTSAGPPARRKARRARGPADISEPAFNLSAREPCGALRNGTVTTSTRSPHWLAAAAGHLLRAFCWPPLRGIWSTCGRCQRPIGHFCPPRPGAGKPVGCFCRLRRRPLPATSIAARPAVFLAASLLLALSPPPPPPPPAARPLGPLDCCPTVGKATDEAGRPHPTEPVS